MSSPAITRRVLRPLDPRRCYWTWQLRDAAAMLGVVDRMDATRAPLPERVFMCALAGEERPGGVGGAPAFAFPPALPDGWAHDDRGHFLDNDSPILRYVHRDGHKVELMRARAWFPVAGDQRPHDCAVAMRLVRALVERAFPGATVLTTPATTGRELVARTLPRQYAEPVLSDDLQTLIRETSGQGRITHESELAARAELVPELARLCVFDGRFAYAALCRELPAGVPQHVGAHKARGLDTYARARYRVRVTIPRDWRCDCVCGAPGHAGVGLLGERDDDGGWRYPSEPGATFETWCEGAELKIVRDHGWKIDAREAIVWERRTHRPLDRWAAKLVEMRDAVEGVELDPGVRALARVALRQILLSTIGALHGAPRVNTVAVPKDDPRVTAARRAGHAVQRRGELRVWHERTPAPWAAMSRPEWSACVWSRARARLLSAPTAGVPLAGALHVPAEAVVAMRTDALYLECAPPAWADDGRPGRFTLRADVPGPLPAPRTTDELRAAVGAL